MREESVGEEQRAGPMPSVAQRAASGALWVLLGFGAYRALGFASSIVLARLLSPADFGLVSFAMILIGAFTLLQDLGVPAAIVYSERDVREVGGTALTINMAAALGLGAATVLVAPTLGGLGGNPDIAPVASALALGLVITSLGSVHGALLTKELAFGRKFLPDVLPLAGSGVSAISLAILGFGAWSLVIGHLVKAVVYSALLWVLSPHRFWPSFRCSTAAELLRYGRHVSLAAVIGFALMNVDYLIVGSALGSLALGLYTMAFVLAGLPSTAISQVVATVAFPAYTQLRNDSAAMMRMFAEVFTLVCALAIPAGLAMFALAPAFVPLLLGEKWVGIVVPLQVLVAFGVLRAVEYSFAPLFKAVGRPDVSWRLSLLRLAVLAPLLVLAVPQGLVAVAMAQVAVAALFVPINGVVLARLVGMPVRRLWQMASAPLAGAAVMALFLAGGRGVAALNGASAQPVGAATLTAVALAAYAVVLCTLNPRLAALGQATCVSILRLRH
ncbi:MAG: lipopolysaccharide biosynthesis protein [Chloroflexi bacterium]|nr:lipopolysaccharide biosynthesis protein [Chloroflexota bacterium]